MKHVVALSGGKDSTALALRLKELNPETPYEFVCTPTGDELPPMQAHWRRLEDLLGGIKMLSTMTLEESIKEQMMLPNFRARWCTLDLKMRPFFTYMETTPPGSYVYVGLRADEPDREGFQLGPDEKFVIKHPFREWRWGLSEVQEYLRCQDVEIPERTDCGACFYQRLGEWKTLSEKYPERYEKYIELEDMVSEARGKQHTFRSPGRDTWPADLRSLREEFRKGRKIRTRKPKDPGLAACPWCSK